MPVAAHDNKPVAILGAGSLGRLWAGSLPPQKACFVSREPSSSEQPFNGRIQYRLTSPKGQIADCSVLCLPVQQINPSLLLLTTKAGDSLPALESALTSLPPTVPIVLFQNGMGLQDMIAKRWPERPILAASTTEGANRPDANTLVHAGRGHTWIGGLNSEGQRAVEQAVSQLAESRLTVSAEPNIHQRLWNKLVVNVGINAFTALLDCPNGDILNAPLYRDYIDALSNEVAEVMAHDGVEPMSAGSIKARIEEVALSTASNTSSMRADCLRGRRTEIDVINGYIVQRGMEAGIPTPVNQMLVRRVKDLTETE